MTPGPPLPIDPVLPELAAALRAAGRAVLQAPPGAGKTTRVPLHLLEAGLAGRILMLEPRRVAARAAAERLAESLGERVGGRVGYRIRGEAVPGSRIEVVTEGVLTRMLQSAPDLPGVGCLIFDEFHERALQADLGLALALEARAALRPDLALLVMSATLDAAAGRGADGRRADRHRRGPRLAGRDALARPAVVGRAGAGARFEAAVAELVLRGARRDRGRGAGLPARPGGDRPHRGAARPAAAAGRRAAAAARRPAASPQQRAALAPLAAGRRLVLATAIAETSLTIPDVRLVVDAGRARRARFDPGSGMTRLVTERVTRAEAEQRRGRAGRVAPGWCYRLWTRGEEGGLAPFPPPEIASADLAGLALELALWGAATPEGLAFLTPPPAPAFAEARALLADLGALDAGGRITGHGRRLAGLPVHPRLGHMLVEGAARGAGALAADLAALIEARDPLRGRGADLGAAARCAARARPGARTGPRGGAAAAAAGAARAAATACRPGRRSRSPIPTASPSGGPGPRRATCSRTGRARRCPPTIPSAPRPSLSPPISTAIRARRRSASPSPLRRPRSASCTRARLRRETVAIWSRRDAAVLARERLTLGALALEDRPWRGAPPEAVTAALLDGIRDLGLEALPWTAAARRFVARVEWLRARGVDLPDFSPDGLVAELDAWLGPWLPGLTRASDLGRLDLLAALEARLDRAARQRLDRLAPAAITAPTGTTLPVDYSGAAPTVSVRLQEMFGTTAHPTLGPDAVPLVIELLSPARRPVQTTADLPGFWASSYADVRRDLRGRYPKHPWPEDPAAAAPTRRAKPRGT